MFSRNKMLIKVQKFILPLTLRRKLSLNFLGAWIFIPNILRTSPPTSTLIQASIVLSKFKIRGPLECISLIVDFMRTYCNRIISISFVRLLHYNYIALITCKTKFNLGGLTILWGIRKNNKMILIVEPQIFAISSF